MSAAFLRFPRSVVATVVLALLLAPFSFSATTWSGVFRDSVGKPVPGARIFLRAANGAQSYEGSTAKQGAFSIAGIAAGTYTLTTEVAGKTWTAAQPFVVAEQPATTGDLALPPEGQTLLVVPPGQSQEANRGSGGQHLSKEEVSSLPLNTRDFSKLLLLAAGTMTDTNGAANFTQQFAMNGQRGVESVFAMDGAATYDPELAGTYTLSPTRRASGSPI